MFSGEGSYDRLAEGISRLDTTIASVRDELTKLHVSDSLAENKMEQQSDLLNIHSDEIDALKREFEEKLGSARSELAETRNALTTAWEQIAHQALVHEAQGEEIEELRTWNKVVLMDSPSKEDFRTGRMSEVVEWNGVQL